MGLKFRRGQKLFPGVNLNVTAKGISATVGIKGLSVNFNKNGAFLNTGIPGTGIYDRNRIATWQKPSDGNIEESPDKYYFLTKNLESQISSEQADSVTSKSLEETKENIIEAQKEYEEIKLEINALTKEIKRLKKYLFLSKLILIGFLLKSLKEKIGLNEGYLGELNQHLLECNINVETNFDDGTKKQYEGLARSFADLLKSEYVWHKTQEDKNLDNRSSAALSIDRKRTKLSKSSAKFINSDYMAFCFTKANDDMLFIYPAFAMLFNNNNNFGLVELSQLNVSYTSVQFHETEKLPLDTEVIKQVWAKENKDGTPDKRFKSNYQIPVVRYGQLVFKSNTGINEVFIFSNSKAAAAFAESFEIFSKQNENRKTGKLETSHLKLGKVIVDGKPVTKWYDPNDMKIELFIEDKQNVKQDLYNQLVAKRRTYDYNSNDIINPSRLSISNDDHLNAWSYWHGNLNADILLIGQDFGDVDYYKKYNGLDDPENATNKRLILLFKELGIDLGESDKPNMDARLYFTNAVLGAKVGQPSTEQKNGGMATAIRSKDWYSETAIQFIKPLIEIIKPKTIITIGRTAYKVISIIYQRDKKSLKDLIQTNPIILSNDLKLFTVYHCSGLGLVSRSFEAQIEDWKKIKQHI